MSDFRIIDGVLMDYYGNDREVFVPEGVTELSNGVFAEYRNTVIHKQIVHLPDSLKKIGERAFYGCKWLETINIPTGVTEIGEQAFYECESLCALIIPDGVTHIAERLCFGCLKLKEIQISSAVNRIGECAFAWTSLERFDLPKGLTRIEDSVFAYCDNLAKIHIPMTIEEISESAFKGMGGEIFVEDGHPVYSSEDGALYRDDGRTLMYVPLQKNGEYSIRAQVEHITSQALVRSDTWRRITLHSGIKSIGDEAICAYRIYAPLGVYPEKIGKNIFCFRSGSDPLIFCELPVDYVTEEAYRRRLALGFCLNHDKYDSAYSANYEAYIKEHLEELKRMANKQKLTEAQEFLAAMEKNMPLVVPEDCSKLKPVEKVELLEKMVLHGDAAQIEEVMNACKKFEFSARALGIACRYRSLDVVQVLVEHGAAFKYEEKALFKTRYAAAIKPKSAQMEYWASYELMLVYTGMNQKLPIGNMSVYDIHFGGMPLIEQNENSAEERTRIVEHLLKKKAIDPSYILIYALMWGNRSVAECILNNGETVDASHPPVCQMLDGSVASDGRKELLATLPLLSEDDCAFAIEKYGEAAEKVGVKIVLPKKIFEERDTVLLKGKVLEQIVRYADTKKLNKTAMLDAVILRNDIQALSILAQAGWTGKKAQMDKLIQLANGNGCAEAAAWLMKWMN